MPFIRKLIANIVGDEDRFKITAINNKTAPEEFQCRSERCMPIVNLLLERGLFMFASKQSYDVYKNGKSPKLNLDGVGIPLFHFVRRITVSKVNPAYDIFMFEVRSVNDPPPYDQYELYKTDGVYNVYKYLYGTAERKNFINITSTQYVFQFKDHRDLNMIRSNFNRDMFTQYLDYNLRWHVSFGLSNFDHYKLIVQRSEEVSLFDSLEVRKQKGIDKVTKTDHSKDLIIGHFTSEDGDNLPGMCKKLADFTMGELSIDPNKFGNSSVPDMSLKFACEALLLYRLELDKKKERRRRNRNEPFAIGSVM